MENKAPILLAPVGTPNSLNAALGAGADAIYLGGQQFNARQYASSFSLEELDSIITQVHDYNALAYITLNTLIYPHEIKKAVAFADECYAMGADALIIQDLGLFSILRERLPDIELHASTQLAAHSLSHINFLASKGFNQVILARELPLHQINFLSKHSPVPLEIFAHGALCVSFSGQCLLSSMIGGRSGNRGTCAQPCRKEYDLVDPYGVVRNDSPLQKYLLSMRELETAPHLDELLSSGIHCLKIEGRSRDYVYVATVTQIYRNLIDNWVETGACGVTNSELATLHEVFYRKTTPGFAFEKKFGAVTNPQRPDNAGIAIGRVKKYDAQTKQVTATFDTGVSFGDVVEIISGNRIIRLPLKKMVKRSGQKGKAAHFIFSVPKPVYPQSQIRRIVNQRIVKAVDEVLSQRPQRAIRQVTAAVTIKADQPVKVTLYDDFGHSGNGVSDFIPEPATKQPLKAELIFDIVSKIKSKKVSVKEVVVDLEPLLFAPKSKIAQAKKDALTQYLTEVTQGRRRNQSFDEIEIPKKEKREKILPELLVIVDSDKAKDSADNGGADTLVIPATADKSLIKNTFHSESNAMLLSPTITERTIQKNVETIIETIDPEHHSILAGNYSMFEFAKKQGFNVIAGPYCNVLNNISVSALKNDVDVITISPEISKHHMVVIAKNSSAPLAAQIFGYLEVMHLKYCPLDAVIDCKKQKDKPCSLSGWILRDKMGKDFTLRTEACGQQTLLNSDILIAADVIPDLMAAGIYTFIADMRNVPEKHIETIVSQLKEVIVEKNNDLAKTTQSKLTKLLPNFTYGHYFRGID